MLLRGIGTDGLAVRTLLDWLAARSLYVIASGVFIGYALPQLADVVGPALPIAVAGMMTIGMLRVPPADLRSTLRRWPTLVSVTVLLLVVCPTATWLVANALSIDNALAAVLVLTATCPPLVSTVSLAWMLGFNPPLALAMVIIATLLCPAALAVCFALLPDVGIELDSVGLFLRVALLIGGCYLLASVLRRVLGPSRVESATSIWDVTTVGFLLLFAIAVMDGVAERASAQPMYVASLLATAFAVNLLLQLVGVLFSIRLGLSSALTVGFACGCRAVGILLAVAPGDASNDVVLFFALYQVPMYTLPFILRPVYRRALRQRE